MENHEESAGFQRRGIFPSSRRIMHTSVFTIHPKLVSGLQWLDPSYRKPCPRSDCSLAECAMCLRARHNRRENRLLINLLESRPGSRLATRLASTVRECFARTSFRALPVEQGLLADASWHWQRLEGSKGSSAPPVFTLACVQSWD